MKQVEIKWSKAVIDRLFWKKEKQTLHNQKVLILMLWPMSWESMRQVWEKTSVGSFA